MPVLRYFLYVGGALLALLLVVNSVIPAAPVDQQNVASATVADQPSLRIRSDHKWPERIVFDTNQPTIVPPPATKVETVAIAPSAAAATVAEYSAKARVRESFAQFKPSDDQVVKHEPKAQPKRKVAKARVAPPPMRQFAQQSQFGFGFFGNNTW